VSARQPHFVALRLIAVAVLLTLLLPAVTATAKPTLKGPLQATQDVEIDADGFAVLRANGHLTLMGRVSLYGEFVFTPNAAGGLDGAGVAAIIAANGDVLVANAL
jgi:hypothetical protein